MKEIPITRGHIVLVDDEDYDSLSAHKWQVKVSGKGIVTFYARRTILQSTGVRKTMLMHRIICPEYKRVDHIDHNGLNNQRNNLRPCTRAQNGMNSRKAPGCSSAYKGVTWSPRDKRWVAQINMRTERGKQVKTIGLFREESDAAQAYNFVADEWFGEFACLNTVHERKWGPK